MLARIKEYSETKLDKIIIATGDTNQLETVSELSNTISYEEYADHCINTMFSNSIFFIINKRLNSDEDRETLTQFKLHIFNKKIFQLDQQLPNISKRLIKSLQMIILH